MKQKINQKINYFGISLLLLSSFYFYEFTYLSLPNINVIILELLKIFLVLFILNTIFLNFLSYRFKNFLLFIYLIYILIFTLKMFFNASDFITLHRFIEKLYSLIIQWNPYDKPVWIKIISYLTPYFFVTTVLIFFFKNFEKLIRFLSILGILISMVVLIDLYQISKKEVNVNNSYNYNNGNQSIELNSKKKVLWILYDALDPEFLDKKINGTKIFKNFNSLKDSGLYFENAYSPGKFTNDSVPGQLMGINILSKKSKHRVQIFETLENKKIPFKFENTIFNTLKKSNLDVSLMSTVLEYCSSYLRSNKWKICKDSVSENKKINIFNDALKFYFSLLFKYKNYLKNLGLVKLDKKNVQNFDHSINFKDLNFDKFNNLKFINSNFYSDQFEIINIDNIINSLQVSNMLFLHIYNPHTYSDNQFLFDNLEIDSDVVEKYFLRYLYTDIFTKTIVEEINNNNLENVLLIISSDHWWRNKPSAQNEDYIGNSFFLVNYLNDNNQFSISKKSTTIIIPDLITNFFQDKLNSNKDFFDYSNNSNVKVHIKSNRFNKE